MRLNGDARGDHKKPGRPQDIRIKEDEDRQSHRRRSLQEFRTSENLFGAETNILPALVRKPAVNGLNGGLAWGTGEIRASVNKAANDFSDTPKRAANQMFGDGSAGLYPGARDQREHVHSFHVEVDLVIP